MNRFTSKSDAALATAAKTAVAVLEKNPGYAVPKATADALGLAGSQMTTLIDAAKTARDAAAAATLAKAKGREATLGALAAVAAIVYSNGTSDANLQALGFSPRSGGSRPVAPITVTGLTVSVVGDGALRLEFRRTGNRASAIFQLERSLDLGASWSMVTATQGTKALLTGHSPATPALFRVTTKNSVGTSLPSAVAGAYLGDAVLPDAPVELKLAA